MGDLNLDFTQGKIIIDKYICEIEIYCFESYFC